MNAWHVDGDDVLIGTANGGVWRSTDGGDTFASVHSNLGDGTIAGVDVAPNGDLWASTGSGAFVSTDDGASWQLREKPMGYSGDIEVLDDGTVLVMFNSMGTFTVVRSTDGDTFTTVLTPGFIINEIAAVGNNVVVGTNNGVHFSTDGGQTFNPGTGLVDDNVVDLQTTSTGGFVCATGDGVYTSADGSAWTSLNLGRAAVAVAEAGGTVWATSNWTGAVHVTTDNGATWTEHAIDVFQYQSINTIVPLDVDTLWVSTTGGSGLHRSDDGGLTFALDNAIPGTINGIAVDAAGGVWAASRGGIFYSEDGVSWDAPLGDRGATVGPVSASAVIIAPDDSVVISAAGHLFRTTDNATLTDVFESVALAPLFSNGTNLVADDNFGVFYSADNGVTWTAGTNVPGGRTSLAVSESGTFLLSAGFVGVRRSTDGGVSWVDATTQPDYTIAGALVPGPGGAVFGVGMSGLIRSTDDGDTWQSFDAELPSGERLALFRAHSGLLMQTREVVDEVNVYRVFSSGDGATWQDISAGLPVHWVNRTTVVGNETWVSTPVGIYKLEP